MLFEKLKKAFPKIRENEPLKNHCTFRVGGPADFFYDLTDIEELPLLATLAEENSVPFRVIGRGTNILFIDKGFRGLIVKNMSNRMETKDSLITADSGVLMSQIIRASVDNGLTGLESFYGLPGTLGGAVFGNAGVPGTETMMFVTQVTLFNVADGIREVPREDIDVSYRRTSLQISKDFILKAILKLNRGQSHISKETMKQIDAIRRGKQPIGYSAGSFFKNPSPEKPAGWLIDQAGLKGTNIGDAKISEKHANFFINIGHATAEEILELGNFAKQKVKEKFGIELEMEVKIIGDL